MMSPINYWRPSLKSDAKHFVCCLLGVFVLNLISWVWRVTDRETKGHHTLTLVIHNRPISQTYTAWPIMMSIILHSIRCTFDLSFWHHRSRVQDCFPIRLLHNMISFANRGSASYWWLEGKQVEETSELASPFKLGYYIIFYCQSMVLLPCICLCGGEGVVLHFPLVWLWMSYLCYVLKKSL